jgi:hypothetical protein
MASIPGPLSHVESSDSASELLIHQPSGGNTYFWNGQIGHDLLRPTTRAQAGGDAPPASVARQG